MQILIIMISISIIMLYNDDQQKTKLYVLILPSLCLFQPLKRHRQKLIRAMRCSAMRCSVCPFDNFEYLKFKIDFGEGPNPMPGTGSGRMEPDDPFASILKFCQPTASQLAMLSTPPAPFHRESEEFPEPDPYPCYSDRIDSDSLHGSQNSVGKQAEYGAVFHTPPEYHLSSSEDQNPKELCAEDVRDDELGGDADVSATNSNGFEGVLGDESGSKRTRVPGVESGGDEIGEIDSAADEIIDSGRADTDAPIVDAGDVNHEMGNGCDEPLRNISLDEGKMTCVSSGVAENLDGSESGDQIENLKKLLSSKSGEVAEESGISKDGNGKEGLRTACKRIEDIDEFRFSGWDDASRKRKQWEPLIFNPYKRKRELPATMKEMGKNEQALMKGKEKKTSSRAGKEEKLGSDLAGKAEVNKDKLNDEKEENVGESNVAAGKLGKKGGIFDILDTLKTIVKNLNDDKGNKAKKCDILGWDHGGSSADLLKTFERKI